MLCFYTKNLSPGCRSEIFGLAANNEKFKQLGFQIMAVSVDSLDSHEDFAKKHSIPFPLLSDKDRLISKTYDVLGYAGLFAKRVTYVIDENLAIRSVLSAISLPVASRHWQVALEECKKISDSV